MTFDNFIKKYDGKGIDWDKAYGYQCVDLYRQYCHEVLNLPQSPAVKGAADLWDTYLKDYFIRVANTLTNIPAKGDIIIWSKETGNGYGHVAICIDGDVKSFQSFDQNWPAGSLCHVQGHYYKNVLGWLKLKGSSSVKYYKGIDLTNEESLKVCIDTWKDVVDGKYVKKETLTDLQNTLKKNDDAWKGRVKDEKERYDKLVKKLASDDYLHCTQEEPDILEQITRLIQLEDEVNQELNPKITRLEARIEGLARLLNVSEEKIEETIKKLLKGKEIITVNDHSKICIWLAKRGL